MQQSLIRSTSSAIAMGSNAGNSRYRRDLPPAHYALKIESFSSLVSTKAEVYESNVFEAEGYKWRLRLFPNGNQNDNGADNISLYLKVDESNNLLPRWEIDVEFKLFVYNKKTNDYLVVQDRNANGIKKFSELRTEWGFSQLININTLNDASNGYLDNDTCTFGAEIFVIRKSCKWECLSMVKKPVITGSTKWEIKNFLQLDEQSVYSQPFNSGGRNWRIRVDPKGHSTVRDDWLSIYLELQDGNKLPSYKKIWAEYKLRLLDQVNKNHHEVLCTYWFTPSIYTSGPYKFVSLGDFHVGSKGYVKNGSIIVEVEILEVSVSKVY